MKAGGSNILLLLILLLAAGLRFYNLFDIPFTHDEFSAIFRTGYGSFNELITKGVIPDFHPPGVQVFIHYYTQLFGQQEWVVKLPFLICGLGSILLVYLLGKEWFNTRTGLLTAAFLAATQYFIFYSQIARPYSPGLFFGLLAVIYWKRVVIPGSNLKIKHWLMWILSAAICSYIHFYLLLSLVLLSIIGLFLVRRRALPLYLFSGVAIALLFLPQLPIFLQQISRGGIESWLAPPTPEFLQDYFWYVFEYTPVFLAGTLLLLTAGIFSTRKLPVLFWVGPSLFILCFLTGYFYSVKINAMLQFSGLIFSLPLLMISLFYLLSSRKWLFMLSMVFIPLAGVYGLIEVREHYTLFYQSPYKYLIRDISEAREEYDEEALIICGGRNEIMRFYLNRYNIPEDEVVLLDMGTNTLHLQRLIREGAKNGIQHVYLGLFPEDPPLLFPLVREGFPVLKEKNSYYKAEFYHFSKTGQGLPVYLEEKSILVPENLEPVHRESLFMTDSGDASYNFGPELEFGLGMEFRELFSDYQNMNLVLDLSAVVNSDEDLSKTQLVISVEDGDSIVHWSSSPMEDFRMSAGEPFRTFHSVALNEGFGENIIVKTYIWNMGKVSFEVIGVNAKVRCGNSKLYSLYTPISRCWMTDE